MALLPADLDRALHAVCARESEDGRFTVATFDDITARMGDPPPSGQLKAWLAELVELGLIDAMAKGWHVTDEGWRVINLIPRPTDEE